MDLALNNLQRLICHWTKKDTILLTFPGNSQHVLFVFFWGGLRWKVNSCTAVLLWGATYRMYSTLYVVSLCSFHQAFLLGVSFMSMRCIQREELTWIHQARIFLLLYLSDPIFIESLIFQRQSMLYSFVCWHCSLKMRYC